MNSPYTGGHDGRRSDLDRLERGEERAGGAGRRAVRRDGQYYGSLVKNGTIESFEPVFLVRHGGDFNGFILIRGDAAKLDALQRSEEFETFTIRAVPCLEGFGVIRGYIGDSLQRVMQQWGALLPK